MKSLREFIKYSAWFFALLLTVSSCKDDIPEEPEEEFKIETEIEVDGEGVLKTKAENSMGWTTGDGIFHKKEVAPVAAYAKSGYELVRFYAKDGDALYQGKSSYEVKVEKSQIFKAEFRTAATYCINCSITNPDGGTVSGIGCGKSNGTYTLTATPKAGWSSSWTTKQVTVNGANVNEAVTFTNNVTPAKGTIIINWRCNSHLLDGIISCSFGSFPFYGQSGSKEYEVAPGNYRLIFSASGIPSNTDESVALKTDFNPASVTIKAGETKSVSLSMWI